MFYCKTHFAAVYSLQRVPLISGSLKDKNWGASSQQQLSCPERVLPKREAPPSSSLEEEEAELWGHGQDTREAAACWAALQTLYSCFLHGIPKKVMWLSPGEESTFCNTGIELHRTGTARLSPEDSLFHSKWKNTSTCIHKAAANYYVNAACWSGYFCFMVGQQESAYKSKAQGQCLSRDYL